MSKTEYTLDELLKIATAKPEKEKVVEEAKTIQRKYTNEGERFLDSFRISPGQYFIRKKYIWEIYKKWNPRHITRREFIGIVDKYLKSAVLNKRECYKINRPLWEIDSQLKEILNEKEKS